MVSVMIKKGKTVITKNQTRGEVNLYSVGG